MTNNSNIAWLRESPPPILNKYLQAAENHQNTLTKPPGSLGRLEQIAIQFAAWQESVLPTLDKIVVRIFAADHGVCAHNISAFPQEVTGQMVANFVAGGAAISVLARSLNADFEVFDVGTKAPSTTEGAHHHALLSGGTNDFTQQAAMDHDQLQIALNAGRDAIPDQRNDLLIVGDMGIGNTSSASALYCAHLNMSAKDVCGRGTGVDDAGLIRKIDAVAQGLQRHQSSLDDPVESLRCLGGFEIAAMVGAYITAAQRKTPCLVDGFISTAAALVACSINPEVRPWLMFGHQSAEPAHTLALQKLEGRPLLNLEMRLGEGSGAAVAVSIIQSALLLHCNMASFETAGVSDGHS